MTASAFEEDILACLDRGMNDVLTKPLRKRELLKKLSEFLTPAQDGIGSTRKKPGRDQPLHYEDFVKEMGGERENIRVILEGFILQLDGQKARIEKAVR